MKGWTQAHIDRLNLKTSENEKVKKTKAKVKTLAKLIIDLDDLFSIWVRRSSEDEQGIIRCFTCKRPMTFKTAQNGHYVGRQHKALRWDKKNCNPQCYVCNILNEGEKAKYAIALDEKYGSGTAENLNMRRHNKCELDRATVMILIEECKKEIELLPNNKP